MFSLECRTPTLRLTIHHKEKKAAPNYWKCDLRTYYCGLIYIANDGDVKRPIGRHSSQLPSCKLIKFHVMGGVLLK